MSLTPQQRDWLALVLVPGIGTTYFIRLLARFHTAHRVFESSEAELTEVVGRTLAQRVRQYREVADVEGQERSMAQCGARLVTMEDTDYPPHLAEIYDPPLVLFVRGTLRDEDQYALAMVGTRRASPYGLRMAERLAGDLATRGVTVVSGMASGVDTAAHRGAIGAGGRTIAVLGCGVDVVYPPENAGLMEEICAHGCVVSQFPMGTQPSKGLFPYRNRIISGMSMGTCIVEAPAQSGALITARQAAEQGREVFAVPGQVGNPGSQGPHLLIREGAKLVENVDDILVELDVPAAFRNERTPGRAGVATQTRPAPEPRKETPQPSRAPVSPAPARPAAPVAVATPSPKATPAAPALSAEEKTVLAVLAPEGSFVDEIAMAGRLSVGQALSTLTILELKGLVRQFSGKRFAPR